MCRKAIALLCFILFAPAAPAQVRVKGAATYQPYEPIVLKASEVTSAKASFLWDVDGDAKYVEAGDVLYVWAAPGSYRVALTAIDFEAKKVERARFSFTVSGAPAPVPPGPTPGPGPTPTPTPVVGMKVLIVYESADRTKYPPGQLLVMAGKPMADWLNANAGKEWGVWDKDTNASGMPKFWQDALAAAQGKALPWVVVGDGAGKVVWGGPLPADTATTIALLSKFVPSKLRKAG